MNKRYRKTEVYPQGKKLNLYFIKELTKDYLIIIMLRGVSKIKF